MVDGDRERALSYAWGEYQSHSREASKRKRSLSGFRLWTLITTIMGAVLGTLATTLPDDVLFPEFTYFMGSFSAALLGLAGLMTSRVLNPKREAEFARIRSTSEAIKSQIFLFLMKVPPYSEDNAPATLLDKVTALLEQIADLEVDPLNDEEMSRDCPVEPFGFDDYSRYRVDDQIRFYSNKCKFFKKQLSVFRFAGFVLAAVGLTLGYFGDKTSAWVAVLSAIAATLSSFVFAGRYQQFILSYRAALSRLKKERAIGPSSNIDDFVSRCENIFSEENSSWLSEWSTKHEIRSPPELSDSVTNPNEDPEPSG